MSNIVVASALTMILLAVAIGIEVAVPRDRRHQQQCGLGIAIYLVRAATNTALLFGVQQLWRAIGVPPLIMLEPGLLAVAVTLVVADFLSYWRHRFEHRFFWPVHAVHHSQTDLHAANSYEHVLASLPNIALVIVPMALLFGGWLAPALALLIVRLHQIYSHSPVTWHFGRLRYLVVDNRFHRVHHSTKPEHYDRNFGGNLTIWDSLFGTAHFPAADEWPDTGVEGHPAPRGLTEYLLFPLRFFRSGVNDRHAPICEAIVSGEIRRLDASGGQNFLR